MSRLLTTRISRSQASKSRNRQAVGQRQKRQAEYPVIHPLLQMQQTHGNRAVSRMIQAHLKVSNPEDKYEQEADRVADQVINSPTGTNFSRSHAISNNTQGWSMQRTPEMEEGKAEKDKMTTTPQTKPSAQAIPSSKSLVASYIDRMQGGGMYLLKAGSDFKDNFLSESLRTVQPHHNASGHDSMRRGSYSAIANDHTAPELEAKHATTVHGDDIAVIRERNGLQTMLIQRDDPHKAGEVTQEETEALINFKDDWRNNFSHYDQLIKISARSYNKTQKEGIKAVKKGNSISITLGKPYFTESDEKIRWQWIKAEVIDKNVKTDKFEDIAYDPTHSKINEIAPPYAAGQYCALNCPATAASLDEYFRTGKVSPAVCNASKEGIKGYGFDISKNTFSDSVSWKKAEATIKNQLKKHGDFVIVEATRSDKQMKDNNLAKNHYFAVVNVKGRFFAMDAFAGGIVNDNIKDYIDNRIKATTYRIVKGEFKVKEVIPKS